ncbi:hypothetical protein DEU56DRAFT_918998 [Suillus clintonianus]|uniref:uncharacterized protein n=1 Tax=Suillus clintonianus TaxID=1904413 RepID=UPI001B8747F3|nr:uncharacterized protein DEU56DRAFT_918998 [Suillus clintonianus]KAG2117734.1 hypothetical protein DEU56DRAFT_918998 [Suillus clintonianus]
MKEWNSGTQAEERAVEAWQLASQITLNSPHLFLLCLTRRVTRAKNATQHPGIPDITPKKKRRTAEEVAAERQSKLDAKEEKERTKRASIKRVAKYEKNQADQDVVTDATPRAALPKPKPIPSKRKAVVAPPATKKKVTPPSDAEMSDARAAPSVPRPRPKPIPRKQKVIVQTPAAEDNGFLSDAEMDDAAADSSAFNPDPTQHSGTTPAWADDSDDVEELKAAQMTMMIQSLRTTTTSWY